MATRKKASAVVNKSAKSLAFCAGWMDVFLMFVEEKDPKAPYVNLNVGHSMLLNGHTCDIFHVRKFKAVPSNSCLAVRG